MLEKYHLEKILINIINVFININYIKEYNYIKNIKNNSHEKIHDLRIFF